jgi:hypothetical protein
MTPPRSLEEVEEVFYFLFFHRDLTDISILYKCVIFLTFWILF